MSFEVMNNKDLRHVIWSYLRKEPKVKCYDCGVICVWDKKMINVYYTEYIDDHMPRYICMQCYWTNIVDLCLLS